MEFQNHRADVPPEDQQAAHDQREAERNELRQHHLAKISSTTDTSESVDDEPQDEPKPKPRARTRAKKTKTAA